MSRIFFLSSAACVAFIATPAIAQQHQQVENVVVTASPIHSRADDLVSIPATVNAEQILQSGGSSLADSLSNIPGVSGSGFAAGASRPVIRGMDASRVRILEDGTSSSDASDIGPDHGVPIDPLSARDIEVVRGAATLRYGSQAIGGVVNALNNRIPTSLAETPYTELSAAYDSAADQGQGAVLHDEAFGNLAVHFDGFYRHTDDYQTPLGVQPNSFFRGDGVSLGSSYFIGDNSRVGAAVIHYDSTYGVPSDTTYIDMRQTKYLTGTSLDIGEGAFKTLNITSSYGNYSHEEKNPDGSVNATFKNREFDGRAEALFGPMGPLSGGAFGIEIQNRDFSALGEGADYLLPTLTQSEAAFVFLEAPLASDLHAEASGRVENVQVQGTPMSGATTRDFTPLSAALGVLWDVSPHVILGLTGSSTGRAPAQTELFARGPHDGPQTYETGNPGLKVERANSVEASLRLRFDGFTFDGSAYSNAFDNYIYGALTGANCDENGNCGVGLPAELRQLNYIQDTAWFRGLEGKGSYTVWQNADGILQVNVLGDMVRATLAGGIDAPRIPPYRYGGGLSWQSDAYDASFQVMQVGAQDHPGPFDTPTPGYVSVDAQLVWRPISERPGIELALVGHNLADEVIRNAASLNRNLVVGQGRSVRLTAKFTTN
jgi:iron complex outermembrane receptor protein